MCPHCYRRKLCKPNLLSPREPHCGPVRVLVPRSSQGGGRELRCGCPCPPCLHLRPAPRRGQPRLRAPCPRPLWPRLPLPPAPHSPPSATSCPGWSWPVGRGGGCPPRWKTWDRGLSKVSMSLGLRAQKHGICPVSAQPAGPCCGELDGLTSLPFPCSGGGGRLRPPAEGPPARPARGERPVQVPRPLRPARPPSALRDELCGAARQGLETGLSLRMGSCRVAPHHRRGPLLG